VAHILDCVRVLQCCGALFLLHPQLDSLLLRCQDRCPRLVLPSGNQVSSILSTLLWQCFSDLLDLSLFAIRGADKVYQKILRPYFLRYQKQIDSALEKGAREVNSSIAGALKTGLQRVVDDDASPAFGVLQAGLQRAVGDEDEE